jgi:hypothetical protein
MQILFLEQIPLFISITDRLGHYAFV